MENHSIVMSSGQEQEELQCMYHQQTLLDTGADRIRYILQFLKALTIPKNILHSRLTRGTVSLARRPEYNNKVENP